MRRLAHGRSEPNFHYIIPVAICQEKILWIFSQFYFPKLRLWKKSQSLVSMKCPLWKNSRVNLWKLSHSQTGVHLWKNSQSFLLTYYWLYDILLSQGGVRVNKKKKNKLKNKKKSCWQTFKNMLLYICKKERVDKHERNLKKLKKVLDIH